MSYDAAERAKALWSLIHSAFLEAVLLGRDSDIHDFEAEIEFALMEAFVAGQEVANGDEDD